MRKSFSIYSPGKFMGLHARKGFLRRTVIASIVRYFQSRCKPALFAFASYNAGAGRISQMREEAARRGLDPNVWFHNVEHVAAEKIGAETVTYVSNIYKYYIAYNLIIKTREERQLAVEKMKGQSK